MSLNVNLRVSRSRGQPLTVTSSKRTPAEGRESLLFGVLAGPPSEPLITGSASANTLIGGAGNDVIDGGRDASPRAGRPCQYPERQALPPSGETSFTGSGA